MSFHAALERFITGTNLGLLGLAAYWQASGIAHLMECMLAAEPGFPVAGVAYDGSASVSAAQALPDHVTSARAILERNPFDSVTPRPLDAPSHAISTAPACDDVKPLIIVAADEPPWSMAAISTTSVRQAKLVRIGDDVGGGRKVEAIEWNRVVLAKGAQLCQVRMFESHQPDAIGAISPPKPLAPEEGMKSKSAAIASKIQRISASEFGLDRSVIDQILENQVELLQGVRIAPEQEGGAVVGIRLFGVRPDTVLGALGLENGDRVQTINGLDLGSPERALEAYARLRTAEHLVVQVNRRGREESLDFNIK